MPNAEKEQQEPASISSGVFDDIVASSVDFAELPTDYWGSIEVDDVKQKVLDEYAAEEGEQVYFLEQRELRRIVEVCDGSIIETNGQILLTCSAYGVTALAYNFWSLAEVRCPLLIPASNVAEGDTHRFVVGFDDLRATERASEGHVRFTFRAEQSEPERFTVVSANFKRPLVVLPLEEFDGPSPGQLEAVTSIGGKTIGAAELEAALNYVAASLKPDDYPSWSSSLEIRDGWLIGGHPGGMAYVSVPALSGLTWTFDVKALDPLLNLLQWHKEQSFLLKETPALYALTSQDAALAFEKSPHPIDEPLKLLETILEHKATADKVIFVRSILSRALAAVATTSRTKPESKASNFTQAVRIRIDFTGPTPVCRLTTKNDLSETTQVILSETSFQRMTDGSQVIDVALDLKSLERVLKAQDSPNVVLFFLQTNKAVLIDDSDGERSTLAILATIKHSPAKASKVSQKSLSHE